MAYEILATNPAILMIKMVARENKRVVHLNVYNSPKSSSVAFDVTVKLVLILHNQEFSRNDINSKNSKFRKN